MIFPQCTWLLRCSFYVLLDCSFWWSLLFLSAVVACGRGRGCFCFLIGWKSQRGSDGEGSQFWLPTDWFVIFSGLILRRPRHLRLKSIQQNAVPLLRMRCRRCIDLMAIDRQALLINYEINNRAVIRATVQGSELACIRYAHALSRYQIPNTCKRDLRDTSTHCKCGRRGAALRDNYNYNCHICKSMRNFHRAPAPSGDFHSPSHCFFDW